MALMQGAAVGDPPKPDSLEGIAGNRLATWGTAPCLGPQGDSHPGTVGWGGPHNQDPEVRNHSEPVFTVTPCAARQWERSRLGTGPPPWALFDLEFGSRRLESEASRVFSSLQVGESRKMVALLVI